MTQGNDINENTRGSILTGLCWEEVSSPQSPPLLLSPRTPGLTRLTGVGIHCVGCHCRKRSPVVLADPVHCRDVVEAEVPVAVSGLTDFLRVWGRRRPPFSLLVVHSTVGTAGQVEGGEVTALS